MILGQRRLAGARQSRSTQGDHAGVVPVPCLRPRLFVVGLGAALLVPLSVGPAGAQAPAGSPLPAGGTVVGKLVRAYADPSRARAERDGEGAQELSWIEPAQGVPVRVPTDQVAHLPLGATVKATVGAEVRDAATTESGTEPARQVLDHVGRQPGPARV